MLPLTDKENIIRYILESISGNLLINTYLSLYLYLFFFTLSLFLSLSL